mgnify:CR=1 FL=1
MKKFVVLLIATVFVLGSCSPSGEITSSTSEQTAEPTTKTTTTAKKVETTPVTTIDTEKLKKDYKSSCEKVTYKEIAREPDGMMGKRVSLTGEVGQALSLIEAFTFV